MSARSVRPSSATAARHEKRHEDLQAAVVRTPPYSADSSAARLAHISISMQRPPRQPCASTDTESGPTPCASLHHSISLFLSSSLPLVSLIQQTAENKHGPVQPPALGGSLVQTGIGLACFAAFAEIQPRLGDTAKNQPQTTRTRMEAPARQVPSPMPYARAVEMAGWLAQAMRATVTAARQPASGYSALRDHLFTVYRDCTSYSTVPLV